MTDAELRIVRAISDGNLAEPLLSTHNGADRNSRLSQIPPSRSRILIPGQRHEISLRDRPAPITAAKNPRNARVPITVMVCSPSFSGQDGRREQVSSKAWVVLDQACPCQAVAKPPNDAKISQQNV